MYHLLRSRRTGIFETLLLHPSHTRQYDGILNYCNPYSEKKNIVKTSAEHWYFCVIAENSSGLLNMTLVFRISYHFIPIALFHRSNISQEKNKNLK